MVNQKRINAETKMISRDDDAPGKGGGEGKEEKWGRDGVSKAR